MEGAKITAYRIDIQNRAIDKRHEYERKLEMEELDILNTEKPFSFVIPQSTYNKLDNFMFENPDYEFEGTVVDEAINFYIDLLNKIKRQRAAKEAYAREHGEPEVEG